MLSDVHVDITIKRPENRPDCHCYVGYGMGCRNGTWRPEWYLISPDQALPNCVWAPPSSAEGGKSCEMRYHPGSWH